jgi:hypothetical protein
VNGGMMRTPKWVRLLYKYRVMDWRTPEDGNFPMVEVQSVVNTLSLFRGSKCAAKFSRDTVVAGRRYDDDRTPTLVQVGWDPRGKLAVRFLSDDHVHAFWMDAQEKVRRLGTAAPRDPSPADLRALNAAHERMAGGG